MDDSRLTARKVQPRIGLLPTGHLYYWDQFPELKRMGSRMYERLQDHLSKIGIVIAPELVDTGEKAEETACFFHDNPIDILFIFPFGYTPGMCIAPVAKDLNVPIRILNAHEDSSYDYTAADTTVYLHHEGVCCIPEYACTLRTLGKPFHVRTGHFGDMRLWKEVRTDALGAAAARVFKSLRFGVIGETYTNMTDMPFDEHRLLRTTGNLLVRPEVEEIEEAYSAASSADIKDMLKQFQEMYDVEPDVSEECMAESARLAVAYDRVISSHDISAFGFYWWGMKENITQLRSEAALAVSRLATRGRPGVTEGDVKTAMAMKIFDLLGAGGMFLEFFAMDFDEDFMLMGHDGPSNINVAVDRPRLKHLEVHHGKSGHGIGIDFKVRHGPVTLLNLTQPPGSTTFRLICSTAEVVDGPVLNIGNPNCRVKLDQPLHDFMDAWCQQGPCHHIALGLGHHSDAIAAFAETSGFEFVRI